MTKIADILNPFLQKKAQKFQTPWGAFEPAVDIFPIIYLIAIYGLIYVLPFGRNIIGTSWFNWLRLEDGPLEWLQCLFFLSASICASIIVWKTRGQRFKKQWICWLVLGFVCFFIAGEEISWGERITGFGFDFLRDINEQGESNIHNSEFFHHTLLDPSIIISCLLFGWLGWSHWPEIHALPKRYYSLYFLPVSLFYFYYDISYASTIKQIRYDGEIFELLLALGLLSHCLNSIYHRENKPIKYR